MRRALFALWLVSSAVALVVCGAALHPPVMHIGSAAFLAVAATWLVGVVPISFFFWFQAQRRREREVVETALKTWREGTAGGGALVASAIELALDEEDEDSLRRLVEVLGRGAPATLGPVLDPFMQAAREWLADHGGRDSREVHLERLKATARPLIPKLQNG